ncbi:transcriptional regulator [Streptomyces sp. NPDC059443]|uniref:transcriptional regulator n=1 Tax=unclassified Streptomyces TaxID=2593676 RepID=UPI00367CB100
MPQAVRTLAKLWEADAQLGHAQLRNTFLPGVFGLASRQALILPPDPDRSGPGSYKVTGRDLVLLEVQTRLYCSLDEEHGGGKLRSVFASFLAMHTVPLLNGAFYVTTGKRLYGGVADAVLAVTSMVYENHLPGFAQRYDLRAMHLAQAIGDRSRIARVHIHQTRLAAAQDDRHEVLTHARSAVVASESAPTLVRAYCAVTEARAWAFNENPAPVLAAVARARDHFERGAAAPAVRWLGWFDRFELEAQAAWVLARAGLADAGILALKAAEGMPCTRLRDRVELLITGAELARLSGDTRAYEHKARQAEETSRTVASRRLNTRITRLTAGQPFNDF